MLSNHRRPGEAEELPTWKRVVWALCGRHSYGWKQPSAAGAEYVGDCGPEPAHRRISTEP